MENVVDTLIGCLQNFSYLGIFVILMLCGLGVPLPEEPVLIASGYVAYQEITELPPTIVVAMAGILLGDLTAYLLGRRFGSNPALLRVAKRYVTLRILAKARRFLRDHGNRTIFIVRFMPGLRMPTYFIAGSMGVRLAVFVGYDFLAALISVPVSIIAAWYFGPEIDDALKFTGRFHRVLLVFLACLVIYWVWRAVRRHQHPAHGGVSKSSQSRQ
ncbi:MAG: DedA family protein [Candidatus Wallbacteria bacterium]|nr:DedA family protein [Candidatus Wallbacteria bacterium]